MPFLNPSSAVVRWDWLRFPWMRSHFTPWSSRKSASLLALCFVRVKTKSVSGYGEPQKLRSEQQVYDDLVGRWGYSEWVRKVHTIPRMHPDYIERVPPREYHDVAFITHEYSHRIIEQIAGLYSQINFKWFDEGLAQYEGQRALVRTSPIAAASKKTERDHIVGGAFAAYSLIPLRDLTTEGQWGRQIEAGGQLAYMQAWAVVDYLVGRYGIDHVQEVLGLVGKGKAFGRAFEKVYGLTVEQAESAFRFSLALAAEGV